MTKNTQRVIEATEKMLQGMQDVELKNALENLIKLTGKLDELNATKEKGLNVFYEVGLATQEIRHSTFLSRLLNPACPHGLGTQFLEKFLQEVANRSDNANIIKRTLGDSAIDKIWAANKISIRREEYLTSEEGGRTDIIIEADEAVVVIENKVLTSTHDNQLKRYEDEYKGKKKILIYLTPNGEKPYDNKTPRPNWCILDYRNIVNIIDKMQAPNDKMKILLEDYKEMVNTEILKKNPAVRNLSKAIWDEYESSLQLLMDYTDNTQEVMKFCVDWLNKNKAGGITVVESDNKASVDFYTPAMVNFFNRHQEQHTPKKLCCRIGTEAGNVLNWYYVKMYPEKSGWSAAQKLIIKEEKKKSYTHTHQILTWQERGQAFDSALQAKVEKLLETYLKELEAFEANELAR